MPELTIFKGTAPILDPINLADNAAAVAINCHMDSGSLEPWRAPLEVATPTKGAGVKSIYRFGQDLLSDAQYWFNWQNDCDVARAPVADDSQERTFFTEAGQPPRVTNIELAVGAELPSNWRLVGTPQPKGLLQATVANRAVVSAVPSLLPAGSASTVLVTVTATEDLGFAVGDTFSAVVTGAEPTFYNGTYVATVTGARVFTYEPAAPGVEAVTTLPSFRFEGTAETRLYTYTWVNDLSQEGPPWLGSDDRPLQVLVLPGQVVTINGFETAPAFADRAGSVIGEEKRLYRSNGGLWMREAVLSPGVSVFVSRGDTVTSASVLEAPYNLPPPADALGVIELENSLMAMFRDQTWMPCKRGYPHAYPSDYWMDVAYPIVGHAPFAGGVIVCTTAKAYHVIIGSDPATGAFSPGYDNAFGCKSKRSICSVPGGVVFASHDGLALATSGGVTLLTRDLMSPAQWGALKPETITGVFHDNRYFGFYDAGGGVKGGFILRLDTGDLTWTDIHATAAHSDPRNDALYLVVNNKIVKWNGGAAYMSMRWRGKTYQKTASGYAGAKVAASGPVTFRHLRDGVVKTERTVTNEEPFNLAGGRCRFDAFEIEGAAKVTKFHASNNRRGLI